MEPESKPRIVCKKCKEVIPPQWWDMTPLQSKWFFQCQKCPDTSSFPLTHDEAMAQSVICKS